MLYMSGLCEFSLNIYIYIYIRTQTYMYMLICVYVRTCHHISVYNTCIYIYMNVYSTCVYIYIYTNAYVHIESN